MKEYKDKSGRVKLIEYTECVTVEELVSPKWKFWNREFKTTLEPRTYYSETGGIWHNESGDRVHPITEDRLRELYRKFKIREKAKKYKNDGKKQ